jgi:hypothetical protein
MRERKITWLTIVIMAGWIAIPGLASFYAGRISAEHFKCQSWVADAMREEAASYDRMRKALLALMDKLPDADKQSDKTDDQ